MFRVTDKISLQDDMRRTLPRMAKERVIKIIYN
jgi:hypothetical protein